MKRKPPKLPTELAAYDNGLKNPTANVVIYETPSTTGADRLVESLLRDSARLAQAVPLIQKEKKRAESARRTIEEFNKNRSNNKKPALIIAAQLMQKYPHLRLPRRTSELAKEVRTRLVKQGGKQPEVRTLRRWLTEANRRKK